VNHWNHYFHTDPYCSQWHNSYHQQVVSFKTSSYRATVNDFDQPFHSYIHSCSYFDFDKSANTSILKVSYWEFAVLPPNLGFQKHFKRHVLHLFWLTSYDFVIITLNQQIDSSFNNHDYFSFNFDWSVDFNQEYFQVESKI